MKMRRAAFVLGGLWVLGGVVAATLVVTGCRSSNSDTPTSVGLPQYVDSIVFLQRTARMGTGNVFDYTDYKPGGRIVKLSPPSTDGKLTNLTAGPLFKNADIMAWDLSFDAQTIVFSARLANEGNYQLFLMGVDGANPRQITAGPDHYVYPIFVPGQKIMFMTSKVVEEGTQQFRDEYERATTSQVGVMNMDGTNELLGPRNVSHRVAPALLDNGNVVYTEWRHLGGVNDGHLRVMNTDMTGMREAFGGEGKGVTNSYLKARFVTSYTSAAGKKTSRLITVGTSRDRTLQSGKLLLVDLNDDEATSKVIDLTPLVPGGKEPSEKGLGRYYDAEPIGPAADLKFLTSWADGPVQSEILEQAKTNANFGIYVFDGKTGKRFPVWDDPAYWDVAARPVRPRTEPTAPQSPVSQNEKSFVIGALNVYESSLQKIAAGSAVKVRLLEGFSSEEGFPNMFGLTEFDGQSRYGEVPVLADGSYAAKIPANVPVHQQLVDKFGLAIAGEDIWISGRPGEQRFCGGCHESRSANTEIKPGSTEAVQRGAIDLDVPRAERQSMDFSYEKIRGVPWDLALQPIFDAKCISCHDGNPAKPGNNTYTIIDETLGTMQTVTFDLRGQKVSIVVGERSAGTEFSASYISVAGLGMEVGENQVKVVGDYKQHMKPGEARASSIIKKLNPPQRFPDINPGVRAFDTPPHPADVGGVELTPDEYYRLLLNIDMGGQFFFRENKRGDY